MQLNERQEQIASTQDGTVVVLAGPGSGKTATLVERIRRLVAGGADPQEIAAVTFTVRAAAEIEDRLKMTLGYAGTIHGLARWILRTFPDAHELGPDFTVLDDQDTKDLYLAAKAEHRLKTGIKKMRDRIAEVFRRGDDPDDLPVEDSPEGLDARRLEVAYRAAKARLRAEDFDGLIQRARKVLLSKADVAAAVRARFRHLSVDEAQDLDPAQDHFLELVGPARDAVPGTRRSVLFVGDPMQSIYGWRGGDPGILLVRATTSTTRVILGQNYRSTQEIVELANRVAQDDPLRPEDYELEAMGGSDPDSVFVRRPFPTGEDEIEAVVSAIQRNRIAGTPLQHQAVLARTNAVLEAVAAKMREGGVAFQHLGQRRARLDQDVLRGAVAYVRAALNPADDVAVLRALACPVRPPLVVRSDTLSRMRANAEGGSLWGAITRGAKWATPAEDECLAAFEGMVSDLRDSGDRWATALDALFGSLETAHRGLNLESRADELVWLRSLLRMVLDGKVPGAKRVKTLGSFLWWVRQGQGAGEFDPEAEAVTLSTIHLAKGLEWPIVHLPGMVEGVFPSAPSRTAEAAGDPLPMEEERRCFFVAATRAQGALVLSTCMKLRDGAGMLAFDADRSRFLAYAKVPAAREDV